MKRVHCLFSIALLSVLFPAHALSQGYEPILQEGKQWYLKSLYGYYKDWQFFVNGDTIVDGVPGHQFCWTMVADEQTDSIVGILPTDTDGRLFIDFHDNTGQTCLYDFTLNVGDSLPPAKIRVSSLESVWCYRHVRAARDTVINGVMRKCLTIHETLCKGPASAYETDTYWIEGVGSVLGVLTPFNFNSVTTMNAVLDSCLLDGQVIARRDDFISMQEKDLRESIPHRGGHSGEPIQNASEPMFTEGKAWDVSYGENLHIRSVVVGDSVVEGRVLKVCRDSVYHTGNTGMTEDDGQISLSLFYEDGCGHVYKYDNGRMALLYDFSLNVGDTVSVGGLDSNARLDVTRVDSVHVDGNARKRLTVRETVRHPASGIATTHDCYWIEGIGSQHGCFMSHGSRWDSSYDFLLNSCMVNGRVIFSGADFVQSGISISLNVSNSKATESGRKHSSIVFDLQGRALNSEFEMMNHKLKPGIYVRDGKKFINR